MRAVIGLLLLFTGAELLYLVVTGHLGSSASKGATGSGPDAAGPQLVTSQPYAAVGMKSWGSHPAPAYQGGLLP